MKYIVLILTMLALTGCGVNPSEFGEYEARSFADKITYVQDSRTGLCFALVASRKALNASQSGMGITEVPCDAVGEHLLR